jgi:hypothetical protein
MFRLAALFLLERPTMRETWMKANYLIAIGVATTGWLWLIAWIALQML